MEIGIKALIKNSGVLVISNASLKAISFFLLPLYTNVLPPEAYGITDTIINASTLMTSLFSLSVDWGMNTYFYEEHSEKYYKKVTSSGLLFFTISTVVCTICVFFSKSASYMLFDTVDYQFAVVLGILAASVKLFYFPQRVSTRMRGNLKVVGIFSIVELSTTLICNILFILVFKLGYISIVWSNFIGQAVTMVLYTIESRKYLSYKAADKQLLKKMLVYSVPITPTLLFDWINNFLNRYFIGHYFTQAEVGLYGIGTRIVGMLSVLTASFLSAYPSFAYSNAKKSGSREQYSIVFDFMVMILSAIALFVTVFSKEIVYIMTDEAYHSSYIVVGLLIFAHAIHTLGLIVGYGITIEKKGKLYLGVSGGGALTNIILNFVLVPRFSYMGAAAATIVAEIIIFSVSYYFSKRLFDCGYKIKRAGLCIIICLAAGYGAVNFFVGLKIVVCPILFCIILGIYRNRTVYAYSIIKEFIRNRK